MKKRKYGEYTKYLPLPLLISLDQITKYLSLKYPIDLGVISITNVTNDGMILGLLSGQTTIIYAITLLAISFLIYYKEEFKENQTEYNLILAGILGNTLDRITQSHVIDFIQIGSFPVFNLADTFIVIGVALMTIKEFKNK